MISLKPRSILQLTIIGFLAVAGIFIVTLIITARQLDGLSVESQRMISQSATAMGVSRTLMDQASAMERNARQFTIVGDGEILAVYADRRRRFGAAVEELSDLNLSLELRKLLEELISNEAMANSALTYRTSEDQIASYFPKLVDGANQVSFLVNDWINSQLEDIRQETDATKDLLAIQTVILVSIALVLAGVFTVLITSPLLQIEKAIHQLGSGLYESSIRIKGPRDLVNLGERLDWLRSRLRKLEQQRSSFLRHVSHELKTPLAAMQESASLLRDGVVGPLNREQEEIIRIQSNNCQRLQTLIDDMLRHNSGSFSVLNAMPQPVRLDRLIENVLAAHELILKSGNLTIKRRVKKAMVQGNPEQLRVVIDNLVTNAIKFSPEGGIIEINLDQGDEAMILDVIDQGPGVPEEDDEKIFEAFYQGNSGKEKFKGNGLGLAIAREYIEANGGTITSVKGRDGAWFRAVLPRLKSHPANNKG